MRLHLQLSPLLSARALQQLDFNNPHGFICKLLRRAGNKLKQPMLQRF